MEFLLWLLVHLGLDRATRLLHTQPRRSERKGREPPMMLSRRGLFGAISVFGANLCVGPPKSAEGQET